MTDIKYHVTRLVYLNVVFCVSSKAWGGVVSFNAPVFAPLVFGRDPRG